MEHAINSGFDLFKGMKDRFVEYDIAEFVSVFDKGFKLGADIDFCKYYSENDHFFESRKIKICCVLSEVIDLDLRENLISVPVFFHSAVKKCKIICTDDECIHFLKEPVLYESVSFRVEYNRFRGRNCISVYDECNELIGYLPDFHFEFFKGLIENDDFSVCGRIEYFRKFPICLFCLGVEIRIVNNELERHYQFIQDRITQKKRIISDLWKEIGVVDPVYAGKISEKFYRFANRELPHNVDLINISKVTTGFDINGIFKILKNIRLKKGLIDYFYYDRGAGGYPVLFWREHENDNSLSRFFTDNGEYSTDIEPERLMEEILANMEVKDDINSIFEIVFFFRFADNFMLFWHELIRNSFLVINKKGFNRFLVKSLTDEIPIIDLDNYNLDVTVRKYNENYLVSFVTWCNSEGLNREYFCLSPDKNNRIKMVRKICEYFYVSNIVY
jgi:hypothetical protein